MKANSSSLLDVVENVEVVTLVLAVDRSPEEVASTATEPFTDAAASTKRSSPDWSWPITSGVKEVNFSQAI
jgi:hypothetical protein